MKFFNLKICIKFNVIHKSQVSHVGYNIWPFFHCLSGFFALLGYLSIFPLSMLNFLPVSCMMSLYKSKIKDKD